MRYPPYLPTGFDPNVEAKHIENWLVKKFQRRAKDGYAVIGISGGKDSTIAAALLANALGPDHVLGLLMPDGEQSDLKDAKTVVETLGIQSRLINIRPATESIHLMLHEAKDIRTGKYLPIESAHNAYINTPPRIRMTTLYAVAASLNAPALVCNTSNLSESYIGYSTKYGDNAGDIAPLRQYTVSELLAIGDAMQLPGILVHKTPSDGLSGVSDEEKTGIPYAILDKYLRTGYLSDNQDIMQRIVDAHARAKHKLKKVPACKPLTFAA